MSLEKFIPIKEEKAAVEGEEEFHSPCESHEPYVLMVMGDSMLPEFKDGDVIVIEPGRPPVDGCYVIAQHKGEYTFRQLVVRDGTPYLHALNENYPSEPLESLESIKGVITQKKSPGSGRRNITRYG